MHSAPLWQCCIGNTKNKKLLQKKEEEKNRKFSLEMNGSLYPKQNENQVTSIETAKPTSKYSFGGKHYSLLLYTL